MKLTYNMGVDFRALGFSGCVVCELHGIAIPASSSELEGSKEDALRAIMQIDDAALAADPVLSGYRSQVASIGRSAKRFPPAAESLLQLIRRTKRFPSINVAVDAYNITVCRTRLALGVHDLDKLKGGVTFRRSAGGEPFRSVGTASAKVTAEGDYLYADDLQVLAWLDARDSDTVKLGPESKNVLIVVQGTSATTREYTRAAIEDAAARIVTYCGGSFSVADVL